MLMGNRSAPAYFLFMKSPWLVVIVGGVLAFFSLILTGESAPKPILMKFMTDLVSGKNVPCYDLGYVLFGSIFLKFGNLWFVFLGQAINYILIGVMSYSILKLVVKSETMIPTIGAILVLIYPEVWLNVHRIVDTNMTILMEMIFIFFVIESKETDLSLSHAIFLGIAAGYMVLTRSNMITVYPMLIIPFLRSARNAAAIIIFTALTLTVLPGFSTDHFYLKPIEGTCTFFGGANPYTKELLLTNLSIERSGENSKLNEDYDALNREMYSGTKQNLGDTFLPMDKNVISKEFRYSLNWVKTNPFSYIELIGIKFMTLIRPDFRGAARVGGWKKMVVMLIQTAMSSIFLVWIFLKILGKIRFFDPLGVAPFSLLYIIPFILTGSDPRYRQPLDVLFLMEIAVIGGLYAKLGLSRKSRTGGVSVDRQTPERDV